MKKNLLKRILTLVGIASLVLLMGTTTLMGGCGEPAPATTSSPTTTSETTAVSEEPITLVFSYFEPPESIFWVSLFKPWFEEVEELSGGRVKVEAHLAGELASLMEAYDATARGAVDMAFVFPMMHPEIFPLEDIGTMCTHDVYCVEYGSIIQELHGMFPEMVAQYTDSGTKLLWAGISNSCGIVSTEKAGPIHTLEDLKGLKSTCTGQLSAARQEALGMVPVSLPPEDCVMSFKTGVLDCGGAAAYLLRDMGWGPVLSYCTVPLHYIDGGLALVMNLDTWNSLPADIQQIWEETGKDRVKVWDELALQANKERLASAPEEFGIEVFEFPKEELAKAAALDKPVREAWAAELEDKGLPANSVLEEFLRLEQEYSLDECPYLN